MKDILTFTDLEKILRQAIKSSYFSASDIAKEVDLTTYGIYSFTGGKNHISVEKGDAIINFLKDKDPMCLKVAIDLHFL